MKKIIFLFSLVAIFFNGFVSCDDEEGIEEVPYSSGKPIVVSDIGPITGGLGTRVVVTGSNFGSDKSKVKLFFNDKESLILSLNNTAIYAMVPKQPGDFSSIKVFVEDEIKPDTTIQYADTTIQYAEGVLADKQFQYKIKATVTTVAGVVGKNLFKDGTALEGSFARPVMISVDNSGTIFVTDDFSNRVRQVSVEENKLSTVFRDAFQPWQNSFNTDYTNFYVLERRATTRPLLFYALSKSSNWLEPAEVYDQKDKNGDYIAGNYDYYGLAADDRFVYLLSAFGHRLVRYDSKLKKMELIGQDLNTDSWAHLAFNKKNGYIYVSNESWGRLYRFDPYHIPEGKSTPWITQDDFQLVAGTSRGSAIEGNGENAQFGSVEGICADQLGNVYLSDYLNAVIWKVDEENNCTILAGVPGKKGYKDGKPEESLFNTMYDVAATPDGIVYVADTYNYVIRCIAIQ